MGSHSLLQGIFPIQGSNLGHLHSRQILYHLSHQGSPCHLLNATERPSVNALWDPEPVSSGRAERRVLRAVPTPAKPWPPLCPRAEVSGGGGWEAWPAGEGGRGGRARSVAEVLSRGPEPRRLCLRGALQAAPGRSVTLGPREEDAELGTIQVRSGRAGRGS